MNEKELKSIFEEKFGAGGDIRTYFAPGRVNLIGEHTDYNGGHVFPCALTIGTYAVARKRDDRVIKLYSANIENVGVIESSLDDLTNKDEYHWANYPLGVVWALIEKGCEIKSGFEMCVWGNIPNGSGLSSSASLEVLTGTVLNDFFELNKSMVDLALVGQYSENNFNGCNCGIMDQFAVAMGQKDHAIFLDCADLSYKYASVKLPNAKIVITNSKVKHSLVDSAYNDRRNESAQALADLQTVCGISTLGELTDQEFEKYGSAIKDEVCYRRAKHAVAENQRTIKAVEALNNNDIATFGKLMNASHVSLRDDYEVSCEEVDFLVETEWSVPGVIGARITGGGFGGCTVAIVENDAVDNFKNVVGKAYKEKYNLDAEFYVVDIGDGAKRIG
ncbi:galactokinase [Pseudobutyrivibrio sp.]|uniref:galactokinase n=1 Tax=Pseudobutyrivibrio sp. TaxID=2014367 RepID=UPI00386E71D1